MSGVVLFVTESPDHEGLCRRIEDAFGRPVEVEAHLVDSVRRRIREVPDAVVVYDLSDAGGSEPERIRSITAAAPEATVVALAPASHTDIAVDCIRAGAVDCVAPENLSRIARTLRAVHEESELRSESARLKDHLLENSLKMPEAFAAIRTQDERMNGLFMMIEAIAPSRHTVLITGETGTGKGLLADAVHRASGRTGKMVTVNVAGLDDTMFSDTLFGHARGAYTGAVEPREGLIERGAGGTVFLDEIGDLSPSSQLKLLRLFEDGEYYPLGADEPKRSTARFIVATNRDPRQLVQEGHFRKDLYYRLSVHELAAPPLRERRCDIDLLAEHFLGEVAEELGRPKPYLPAEIVDYLHRYRFPGNVRELRSVIAHAVSRATNGRLSLQAVREFIQQERMLAGGEAPGDDAVARDTPQAAPPESVAFPETLPSMKEMRGLLIEEALRRSGGNQSLAAALIGLTPSAINKHLRQRV